MRNTAQEMKKYAPRTRGVKMRRNHPASRTLLSSRKNDPMMARDPEMTAA